MFLSFAMWWRRVKIYSEVRVLANLLGHLLCSERDTMHTKAHVQEEKKNTVYVKN